MVNDRGTKKWTSLMLPEHVEMLKNVFAEQEHKEKPILDEQQIMENEEIIKHAIHDQLMIEITYFKDHDFQVIQGKVTNITDDHLSLDQLKIYLQDIIEVNYI